MNFAPIDFTPKQLAFQQSVNDFVAQFVTPEVIAEAHEAGDLIHEGVHRELGHRGWVLPDWPIERGGAGLDDISLRILDLTLRRSGLPLVTMVTTRLVVPSLDFYGSPFVHEHVLPGIANGTINVALGYSESESGSDIASAMTRAERDGEDWVINGHKMWTTSAQNCKYAFLITRTDRPETRHRGLTMFLLPLDAPGVEISPIRTYGGERTNIVYLDNVIVDDKYRLGEVNNGWQVLIGPLHEEHAGSGDTSGLTDPSIGGPFLDQLDRALEAAFSWATTAEADGSVPLDDPLTQHRISEVLLQREAAACAPGEMGRVACSDALVRGSRALLDLVGTPATLQRGFPNAFEDGVLEFSHRWAQGTAIYGGTTEVFRQMIAERVLGLPRAK